MDILHLCPNGAVPHVCPFVQLSMPLAGGFSSNPTHSHIRSSGYGLHKCTSAQMCQCTSVPVLSAPVHNCTCAPVHKCSIVHKCTSAPVLQCTCAPVHLQTRSEMKTKSSAPNIAPCTCLGLDLSAPLSPLQSMSQFHPLPLILRSSYLLCNLASFFWNDGLN